MSTTHHMKMARASQKDIDAALELYQFLEAMRDGRPASDAVDEFGYEGYGDLLELAALRQAGDTEFLLRAHERGGLFRVVFGMHTLLDPHNEVVDPNLPHLELHPKHEQAAKERDAARAEAESFRTELAAHIDARTELVQEGIVQPGETMAEAVLRFRADAEKLRAELAASQPTAEQPVRRAWPEDGAP